MEQKEYTWEDFKSASVKVFWGFVALVVNVAFLGFIHAAFHALNFLC